MDTDALTQARKQDWDKLAYLAGKQNLDGIEADQLIELYQRTAADLSEIKTTSGSTQLGDWLSVQLSRARLRFTGTAPNFFAQIPVFFTAHLPAALYRVRWFTLASLVFTFVVATLYAVWALNDPNVMANFGTESARQQLAESDFVNYYSNNAAASFMGLVWTNNAWLALQCIAFGILGVFVPFVLLNNAQNLGVSGAVMTSYDKADQFFLYLLPHGQIEMYAVFVAAGAGMYLFWVLLVPGKLPRLQALAAAGRSVFTIAIGLVITLFVAGMLEGFVTAQPWPWVIKIGLGSIALIAFLLYQFWLGRRAVRAGYTGDISKFDAGARKIYAG